MGNSETKDFVKGFEELQFFFKNRYPKKYLTMLFANYLEVLTSEIKQNFKKIPENTSISLENFFIELSRMKSALEIASFFETYGNYLKNFDLVLGFFNESREILKVFPLKSFTLPSFSKEIAKTLDLSAKYSVSKDSNELYAAFFEETPPTFSKFLKRLPSISNAIGFESCEFPEKKVKTELFGSCSDIFPKKKLCKTAVSQFLQCFLENPMKFADFSRVSEQKPVKFKFSEIDITRTINVIEVLVLKVVETPATAQNDPFTLNSLIKIFPEGTISIGNGAKMPFKSKNMVSFGRFSQKENTSDVSFGEKIKRISRKQFSIVKSEEGTPVIYKLQCTAIPPKQETCWKLHDEPISLKYANFLTLSPNEVLLVRVFEGEAGNLKSQEADLELEDSTEVINLNKIAKTPRVCLTLEGICREENSQSFEKSVRISFIEEDVYQICWGFHDNNANFIEKGEIKEIYEPFHIGKDWIFAENSINDTGLRIFYKKRAGWYAQGLAKSDARYKKVQTLVSVNTYNRYSEGKSSRHEILQEHAIIYIAGYAFLVCH